MFVSAAQQSILTGMIDKEERLEEKEGRELGRIQNLEIGSSESTGLRAGWGRGRERIRGRY